MNDDKALLKTLIASHKRDIEERLGAVKMLQDHVRELETELRELETSEWLAANDALDLQPGTELAVCESFIQHILSTREGSSVAGIKKGWKYPTIERVQVQHNAYEIGERGFYLGLIPLSVVRDMRKAFLAKQAVE